MHVYVECTSSVSSKYEMPDDPPEIWKNVPENSKPTANMHLASKYIGFPLARILSEMQSSSWHIRMCPTVSFRPNYHKSMIGEDFMYHISSVTDIELPATDPKFAGLRDLFAPAGSPS